MKIEEILDYKLKKLLSRVIEEEEIKDPQDDSKVIEVKKTTAYDTITEEDKKFILAQAKTKIQAYCHRRDMPKAIYYIWADIAIEILKNMDSSLFEKDSMSDEDIAKRVTSIRTGDTTIDVNAGTTEDSISTGYTPTGEDGAILGRFTRQLQAFRKVAAGCGDGLDGV